MANSCIYFGHVMHQRLRPFMHRFRYRIFSLLIDLDELESLQRHGKIISGNRFNIFSVYDRDHARRDGSSAKAWVLEHAAARGLDLAGGKIFMLCFPRLFGYVFNPLTMYFCRTANGDLAAILYEVKNTFGDQHGYFMPIDRQAMPIDRQAGQDIFQHGHLKEFHVSPFLDVAGEYAFTVRDPAEKLSVLIRHKDDKGDLLLATWNGRRAPLAAPQLLKALLLFPFQAMTVVLAIHWQALRLWLKGAKFYSRPQPPENDIT
ncbi:MAG: DUF1365 domain-containing protein [Micavibrio sp.]|nr:DUF1365 domain-containing protein [Micavibrio sp.]